MAYYYKRVRCILIRYLLNNIFIFFAGFEPSPSGEDISVKDYPGEHNFEVNKYKYLLQKWNIYRK